MSATKDPDSKIKFIYTSLYAIYLKSKGDTKDLKESVNDLKDMQQIKEVSTKE